MMLELFSQTSFWLCDTSCVYAWMISALSCIGLLLVYRLDIGDGKEVDLPECKRSKLHEQQIEYLGPVSVFSMPLEAVDDDDP
jgi:cell division protein FtsW (lipid II flippase)